MTIPELKKYADQVRYMAELLSLAAEGCERADMLEDENKRMKAKLKDDDKQGEK